MGWKGGKWEIKSGRGVGRGEEKSQSKTREEIRTGEKKQDRK